MLGQRSAQGSLFTADQLRRWGKPIGVVLTLQSTSALEQSRRAVNHNGRSVR